MKLFRAIASGMIGGEEWEMLGLFLLRSWEQVLKDLCNGEKREGGSSWYADVAGGDRTTIDEDQIGTGSDEEIRG